MLIEYVPKLNLDIKTKQLKNKINYTGAEEEHEDIC